MSTWRLVLRCYECHWEFPVAGIAKTEIGARADASRCAECGADGGGLKSFFIPHRHLIVSLVPES